MTEASSQPRVWFVTGASRGFGLEIVRQALHAGESVVATARDPQTVVAAVNNDRGSGELLTAALDVTDAHDAHSVVELAVRRFGRIDVLVNNAGRGLIGAVEEVTDAEARSLFDVNFFGVLHVTQAVLPVMRTQQSGHIINMSSMGGFTQPVAGWSLYGASKFAVEGLSEALANEVRPFGIIITLVEPGSFRTDFLDPTSLQLSENRIDAYADTAGRARHAMVRHNTQPGDPPRAVSAIRAIAGRDDAPLRLPLGDDAVAAIEAKLVSVRSELDNTRALAATTRIVDKRRTTAAL